MSWGPIKYRRRDKLTVKELLARRPTLSYFTLVFLIAWGAVVVVVRSAGITSGAAPSNWQLLLVFGAMLLGPALAGLIMTAVTNGIEGRL